MLSRIAEEIAASGGWISFARYMELALYEPGLGYYAGAAQKLGRGGDFVTAPELGRLFARTLSRQLKELLGKDGAILEFGAGSGALAEALIAELGCPYLILETSPDLRARQEARLGARARWLDALPERWRGVVIANEVLDAMPVHAVAWTAEGIMERGVALGEHGLVWRERPAGGELLERAAAIAVEPRYESEIGLVGQAWLRAVGERLEHGAILIVDYGFSRREYYHPQRSMGTLMCHHRHQAHGEVFFQPGRQDVTAHVDFSALAAAAADAGLEV